MDRRRLFLGLALVLTVSATVWVSTQNEEDITVVAPAEKKVRSERVDLSIKQVSAGQTGLLLDKLPRTPDSVGELNPFNAKSWYVPPPPPPPAPPPKPTAPPLPFAYVGKLDEGDGGWTVYLSKGEQAFAIKKGETFDGVYRLEGIENDALVIQYVPLSTKQLLPIGGLS